MSNPETGKIGVQLFVHRNKGPLLCDRGKKKTNHGGEPGLHCSAIVLQIRDKTESIEIPVCFQKFQV